MMPGTGEKMKTWKVWVRHDMGPIEVTAERFTVREDDRVLSFHVGHASENGRDEVCVVAEWLFMRQVFRV